MLNAAGQKNAESLHVKAGGKTVENFDVAVVAAPRGEVENPRRFQQRAEPCIHARFSLPSPNSVTQCGQDHGGQRYDHHRTPKEAHGLVNPYPRVRVADQGNDHQQDQITYCSNQ